MDVVDQLHALRSGQLSRRAFNRSLFALGISTVMIPVLPRRATAAPEDHATWFTWGGFDVPEYFDEYVAKHGELPNFSTYGSAEEALNKMQSGFVPDIAMPCLSDVPRWSEPRAFSSRSIPRGCRTGRMCCASLWDVRLQPQGRQALDGALRMGPDLDCLPHRPVRAGGRGKLGHAVGRRAIPRRLGMSGRVVATCLVVRGDQGWGAIRPDPHRRGIPEDIAAVLREQRPLIRVYTDDTTSSDTALASGETRGLTMAWNSSVVSAEGARRAGQVRQAQGGRADLGMRS